MQKLKIFTRDNSESKQKINASALIIQMIETMTIVIRPHLNWFNVPVKNRISLTS